MGKRQRKKGNSKRGGAQTPITSTKNANLIIGEEDGGDTEKGKEFETNVTEDQKIKMEAKEMNDIIPQKILEATLETTPTATKVAANKNTKSAKKDSVKPKSDNMATNIKEMKAANFKFIDDGKQNLDPKATEVKQKATSKNEKSVAEKKKKVNEFKALLQGSKDMDYRKQNLDLSVSKEQQALISEKQWHLSDVQTEEPGDKSESINLKNSVTLCFEYDASGDKKVFFDDKEPYFVSKKHKTTFNIGDGNAQLSFIGNKIFISTREDKIDCSMLKNQVIFSLTNKVALPEPLSEGPNVLEVSGSKDTAIVTDPGSSDVVGATGDGFSISSEEINTKSDSNNILKLPSKSESHLGPSSKQESLQSLTENFLTSIQTSCEKFENDFLYALSK